MILAIDIGNSNIVAGLLDKQKKVLFSGRMPTDKKMSKEKTAAGLMELLEAWDKRAEGIEGAVISSVVPEITEAVKAGTEAVIEKKVIIVEPGIVTGLVIDMDDPAKVGADLIVDAVAAAEEYTGALAIFDMGTATTCSVVSADKTYLGTIIMPGLGISQEALAQKASQLPSVSFEAPGRLMGKNTRESMLSGMVYGNAAMLDGLLERIEDSLGERVTALATGGIAGLIVPYCRRKISYDPDLLLKGLWYIYYKNSK